MGKKNKGHKMSSERKLAKKGLGYLKVTVGVTGFGQGPIRAALESRDGTWDKFPNRTIFYSTGFNPGTGQFDGGQAAQAVGTYIATAVMMKIISWGQKQI